MQLEPRGEMAGGDGSLGAHADADEADQGDVDVLLGELDLVRQHSFPTLSSL